MDPVTFSLLQVPLSLLALLAPVPPQPRQHRHPWPLRPQRRGSLLVSDLVLDSASLAGQPLQLEQRSVVVDSELLRPDLAFRAGIARKPSPSGTVPPIQMLI